MAVRELLLLDGENGAGLHIDVSHDAGTAGLVSKLHVIASRVDARDAQALVVVDRAVAIVLVLVGVPGIAPGRRELQARDCIEREIPESNGLLALRHRLRAREYEGKATEQDPDHAVSPSGSARSLTPTLLAQEAIQV